MLRFLVVALIVYIILRVLWPFVSALIGSSTRSAPPQAPPKPKEDYHDVQDAKFIDIGESKKSESPDQ